MAARKDGKPGFRHRGIRRSTLLRLLRQVASKDGINRNELTQSLHSHRAEDLDNILRQSYPKGLHGLVSEETCRNEFGGIGRHIHKWFTTEYGKEFLAALERDEDALPPRIGYLKRFVSDDARKLAVEERRKAARHARNQEKYREDCAHPKHCMLAYRMPPDADVADIDINSAEFRELPSLVRVQILRAKKAKPSEFFIYPPIEPWTPEEWARVEASWNPKAKSKPAPKPSDDAPPKAAEPAPKFSLPAHKQTPEEKADHERRVREFMAREKELRGF